jgi:hypothetical protein
VFIKQEPNESVASYTNRFEGQVLAVESVFGPLVPTFDMKSDPNEEQMKNRNKLLACLYLAGSDRNRYKTVVDDLGNEFQMGKTSYPEDVTSMSQLLSNRRGINTNRAKQIEEMHDGVLTCFHQQQKSHPKLRCWYCKLKGHVSEVCQKRLANKAAARSGNNNNNNNDNNSSGNTSNTQGWFDNDDDSSGDRVSSFQYMETRAWNQR